MDINIIYNDSSREESSTGDDTDQYPPTVIAAMKEFKGNGKVHTEYPTHVRSFEKNPTLTPTEDPQNDKEPYHIGKAFFCFGSKP